MKFIGIDPGLKGGIAVVQDSKIISLSSIPTFKVEHKLAKPKVSKKGSFTTHKIETHIDPDAVVKIFKDIYEPGDMVYIEDIASFFGISAAVNFKMGYSVGVIQSILHMNTDIFMLVKSGIWQKTVWIDSDKVKRAAQNSKVKEGRVDTKATSLNAANRIFGSQDVFINKGCRTPDDGLVDAALIAYFGQIKGEVIQ